MRIRVTSMGAKLIAGLVLWTAIAAASCAKESGVMRATLANGLRVIIVENKLAPVVATSLNYLVGSIEAPDGFPGMAHAQEHMMFRGSPELSEDQLAAISAALGGRFNANTREGLTQYLYTVPAEDLDVVLQIEADRMRGVLDSQAGWEQERPAIEQEVAQDLSNPEYVLYTKLRAAFFSGSPYEHDALGSRESFDKTSAAMLKRFHDTWYVPNNAILIVVGDLDPAATMSSIERLFGPIEAKPLPDRPKVRFERPRTSSISEPTDRPNGTQILAMRMPGLDSRDFPAIEVLADVLNSQRFALHDLVAQGKAINAYFALDPLPLAAIGYAAVSFPKGTDPAAIEAEVRGILASVAEHGVSEELVEAAILQERRNTEFRKNSIEGLASVWADAVALYGLESPEDDLARIERVSAADVKRVARKYLVTDDAVSASLIPQASSGPVATAQRFGGQESFSLAEASNTRLPDWAESAVGRLAAPDWPLQPVVSTLPNGIRLIVQPENVSDTVGVYGHIENRPQVEEAAGKEGVAPILEQLFEYGSENLDRVAFQKALDAIGAEAQVGADFSIELLAEDFDRGVGLLADGLLHPALPREAFEAVQNRSAALVAARRESPSYIAQRALLARLFPPEDPSLREATAETVRSLSLADVRAYYDYAFRPDLATIVVIGNVTPAQAKSTIEKYFAGWSAKGPKPDTDLPAVPRNAATSLAVPDNSRVQDSVILAQTFPLTRNDPDYYALQLGNAVLGGSFYSTRLSIDLRKNSGLVYSVGTFLQTGKTRSVYITQFACDPINVSNASDIVAQELKKLQDDPVPDSELAQVKALLLRQIPLSEASVTSIARGFIERSRLGLSLDEPVVAARRYVELSPRDVQAAFQKWIRSDGSVQVSQGPAPL